MKFSFLVLLYYANQCAVLPASFEAKPGNKFIINRKDSGFSYCLFTPLINATDTFHIEITGVRRSTRKPGVKKLVCKVMLDKFRSSPGSIYKVISINRVIKKLIGKRGKVSKDLFNKNITVNVYNNAGIDLDVYKIGYTPYKKTKVATIPHSIQQKSKPLNLAHLREKDFTYMSEEDECPVLYSQLDNISSLNKGSLNIQKDYKIEFNITLNSIGDRSKSRRVFSIGSEDRKSTRMTLKVVFKPDSDFMLRLYAYTCASSSYSMTPVATTLFDIPNTDKWKVGDKYHIEILVSGTNTMYCISIDNVKVGQFNSSVCGGYQIPLVIGTTEYEHESTISGFTYSLTGKGKCDKNCGDPEMKTGYNNFEYEFEDFLEYLDFQDYYANMK